MRKVIVVWAAIVTSTAFCLTPITTWMYSENGIAQLNTTKYLRVVGTNVCNFTQFGMVSNIIGAPLCGMFKEVLGWAANGKLLALDLNGKVVQVSQADLLWVAKPVSGTNGNLISLIQPLTNSVKIVGKSALLSRFGANTLSNVGFVAIGRNVSPNMPTLICINDAGMVFEVELRHIEKIVRP